LLFGVRGAVSSENINCSACSAANPATNRFCESCGAPLGRSCAHCGAALQATSRFCGQCGAPAAETIRAEPQPTPLAPVDDGERKRISVLFADIRNSTALIDGADPEVAAARFAPVIAAMREAVDRYNGVVNDVLGDGVMALFGAPKPAEDHAVLACMAALAIQEQVHALNDPDIGVRVGIHSGEVVVRSVQTSLTTSLGAVGAAVHLANRMEQLAEVGGVYCSADTYEQARQYVEAEHVGKLPVRGVSALVDVYKVTGIRNAPASDVFRGDPELQPLSGRGRELEAFRAALAQAEDGAACVVGVVGEAGIGKSRLCFEFVEQCRRRNIYVLEARAAPFGQAMPFQPILDLLRDYFGIRSLTEASTIRDRVTERLRQIDASEETLALALDFLGVAQSAMIRRFDPAARKQRLIDFICSLPQTSVSVKAAVLLIEDVHWIDSGSAEIIEALADSVFGTKTMLVLNFRPGLVLSCMQRGHYRQIALDALDRAATESMIVRMIGADRSTDELRRELAERSQGNPMFLQELMRAIVDGGGLEGERGAYKATANAQLAALPPNVQGLLATRIDRLEPAAKQLLQIATVIGREAPLAVLAEVAGVARGAMGEMLRELRRAELALETAHGGDPMLIIRQPLVQEVAYRSLLSDRKRKLHSAVAVAMQKHFKDRLDENAGLLAFHLEQAGDLKQAAQFLMRSAIWVGANDPRQALAAWKKVVELLADQPDGFETDYLRMMACGQVVNFSWREGVSAEEARSYFEKASALAAQLKNPRANALIHAAYGRVLAASGSADEYVRKIREAEAVAGDSSDGSLQVTLGAVLCHALRLSGRLPEALAVNDTALARADELAKFDRDMLGFDVEIWLYTLRGRILVWLGRDEEARDALDRVIALDASKVEATHRFIPHLAYVEMAWSKGDASAAAEHAAIAMQIAAESGTPYVRVYAQWMQGLAYSTAGEHARAAALLRETLDYAREKRAGLEEEARILSELSTARLATGMASRGYELANDAVELARRRCARAEECRALISRAAAARALGRLEQFEADKAAAVGLMEETGARLLATALLWLQPA